MALPMEGVKHLKIPLEEIKLATKNFGKDNFIAKGGFGNVYKGELSCSGSRISVAIKRLDRRFGQGDREFVMEITMLSCYRHKNLASLVGFCDESGEKILVYAHESRGSLDKYISNADITWMQRLKISIDAARGLNFLHDDVGPQHRILHRDIKSANILLNEEWEAKVSDFGLSKIGPSNTEYTFLVTGPVGTVGYIDPVYAQGGVLTKESDVYSFGVVLFEILCGRLACEGYQDRGPFLAELAKRHYEENTLDEIIDPNLRKQMNPNSLNEFSRIAYQCLKRKQSERPKMAWIVEELENAFELQACRETVEKVARVGMWGTKSSGDAQHRWSFQLEEDHILKMITIDHGDLIYSLMFTSESKGVLHTSNKAGSCNGRHTVTEVAFDDEEEIIGINGTVGISSDYTVISSLSFVTNKMSHGPFGHETGTPFIVPWDKGLFAGFYGLAGNYIDGIGVYLKASFAEITKVGPWGTLYCGGSNNQWCFELDRKHHLKKITIDHGDLIYSLVFTTEYNGLLYTTNKVGGWNGGDKVNEVTFEDDEEIIGINGTIGVSNGYSVISSLSFVTNKTTHGPFGRDGTTPFIVPWDKGLFAGFYGLAGNYIDGIGVYMNASFEEITSVGLWGAKYRGGPQNQWSFQLERKHFLKKITIEHGDRVYSLMFTTEYRGLLHTTDKIGGWSGGDKVDEVTFEDDEEIIGINGTTGVSSGYTVISSLSFVTNKTTHGPFGRNGGASFTWDEGLFGGLYGLAGNYIDGIGVYTKASFDEITRVGLWGTIHRGGSQNQWYFHLDIKHHLKKITIDYGDMIYSLMFTTEYKGSLYNSHKSGGWNGGHIVFEVIFDWDEEINGINGTVGLSEGTYVGEGIISSLSFVTDKKTHGPFGRATGTPFIVPWDKGTFAGFYGLAGDYIDAIGVYLKVGGLPLTTNHILHV